MLFGIELRPVWIVIGGLVLAMLIAFQILEGMRIIRIKGPLFMKVHRTVGWLIAAVAVGHGFAALTYIMGWRIG